LKKKGIIPKDISNNLFGKNIFVAYSKSSKEGV
jgi:hypothetical protein